MEQETKQEQEEVVSSGSTVKMLNEIKRATKKRFSTEEKIRIVLEGFRKEMTVTDLCRKEGLNMSAYYSWLKDFMEAGKSRLKGNTLREANSSEVEQLRRENARLKDIVGEQALEIHLLKKSVTG